MATQQEAQNLLRNFKQNIEFFNVDKHSFRPFQQLPVLKWKVNNVRDRIYLTINDGWRVGSEGNTRIHQGTFNLKANVDWENLPVGSHPLPHEIGEIGTERVILNENPIRIEFIREGHIEVEIGIHEIRTIIHNLIVSRIPEFFQISSTAISAREFRPGRYDAVKINLEGKIRPVPVDGIDELLGIPELDMKVELLVGITARNSMPHAYPKKFDIELDASWWDRIRTVGLVELIAEHWEPLIETVANRLFVSQFFELLCQKIEWEAQKKAPGLSLYLVKINPSGIVMDFYPRIIVARPIIVGGSIGDI